MQPRTPILSRSTELFETAKRYIPGGVNSPVRAFKAVGGVPRFMQSAQGAYLTDVDGNTYVDYIGSWGPMILGHHHPSVIQAVHEAVDKALSFGAPCEGEVVLAKLLCERIPSLEKVRMVNSGTEATMTAIRLARGATGRDKIIKFEGCYHGHADAFLVKAGSGALTFGHPSSPGVTAAATADTLVARFNDLDSVAALFEANPHSIAALIVEPIAGNMNMILPKPGFLEGLRALCDQYQALLVFDEVITGFRVGLQGAQGLYQIKPDLTCLGKIIGGGLPVGAFGGRAEIMDQLAPMGPVYQAGTLSGNPLAMAAGIATLSLLKTEHYTTLAARTAQLLQGLQEIAGTKGMPLQVNSVGGMFGLYFTAEESPIETIEQVMAADTEQFNQFFHHMLQHGCYFAPSKYEAGFMSLAHDEIVIQKTLAAFAKCDYPLCR